MKRSASALLTLIALCTTSAWAEECQITLSSPEVSFGSLKMDDVVNTQQGWNQLPSREMTVNAWCQDKQKMAVFIQASAGEKGRFYFGDSSGLAVRVGNMVVDGESYSLAKTVDRSNFVIDGSAQQSLLLQNNNGVVAVNNGEAVSGQQMSFNVTLTPVINDNQFTHTGDVTTLESNLSWELLTASDTTG